MSTTDRSKQEELYELIKNLYADTAFIELIDNNQIELKTLQASITFEVFSFSVFTYNGPYNNEDFDFEKEFANILKRGFCKIGCKFLSEWIPYMKSEEFEEQYEDDPEMTWKEKVEDWAHRELPDNIYSNNILHEILLNSELEVMDILNNLTKKQAKQLLVKIEEEIQTQL